MAEILMRVKKKKKMTITIQEGSNVFSRKIMKKKKCKKDKWGKNKMAKIERRKRNRTKWP